MTATTSSGPGRARWLMVGAALGAMVLATVLWIGGTFTGDHASMEMDQTPPMDMPGMDMGGEIPASETVRITPAQIAQFGITFATAEERTLEDRLRTVGVIEVNETRRVDVTTKFPGYVDRLYADFTGRFIEKGSRLLDVYAPALVAAQEEVLLARQLQERVGSQSIPGLATTSVDLEATARRRLSLWDITEDQIDALLANGVPSRTLSLRAPISGVILEKGVVEGAAFQAGETLFRLADLSDVWVNIEIRESEAALVALGSGAVATLAAYPDEAFSGVVDFVYPTVDARTRSVRARVVLRNPTGRLRPGMFASVRINTPHSQALSVPADAVVWTGDRTLLFVEQAEGGIRAVEAELGATVGDFVIVRSGVTAGQRVVSSAQYLIDAEANIGAIMRSMMGMMGAGDMSGMDMDDMDGGGMEGMEMPTDSGSMSPNPSGR